MKTFKRIISFFMFAAICLLRCHSIPEQTKTVKEKPVKLDSSATLKFVQIEEDSSESTSKLMHLDDIKNRTNETEIRVWMEYALSDSGRLVILKKSEKGWSATKYDYKYIHDGSKKIVSIASKNVSNEPSSGWTYFSTKIEKMGLYNLKDYTQIQKYARCSDGDFMFVEVWNKQLYSKYDYPCFSMYFEEVSLEEMGKLKAICSLIQKEFDFQLLNRPK